MKPLPQSMEAEAAVLGAVLLRGEPALRDALAVVNEADFHDPRHAVIFAALRDLSEAGRPIDAVSVADLLGARKQIKVVGGIEYLDRLHDRTAVFGHIVHHAEAVRRYAALRRVVDAALQIAEAADSEGVEDFEGFLARAEERVRTATGQVRREGYQPAKKYVQEVFRDIQNAARRGNPMTGVATGYYDLDRMTCGLQAGDLIVLAARPSMGKTALALNICEFVGLGSGLPVLIFSLEMGGRQLVARSLASVARVDGMKVRRGELLQDDWRALTPAGELLAKSRIFIDEQSSPSILDIQARARRWRADPAIFPPPGPDSTEDPKGLVVIDYLQLVRGGKRRYDSREQEVADISRTAKAIAKELAVPVLALSQLNRAVDGRADHRPQLSDLRESGAIEQDSDVVMFLYREERYEADEAKRRLIAHKAELDVAKARNGPTGVVQLHFEKTQTRFLNATRGDA